MDTGGSRENRGGPQLLPIGAAQRREPGCPPPSQWSAGTRPRGSTCPRGQRRSRGRSPPPDQDRLARCPAHRSRSFEGIGAVPARCGPRPQSLPELRIAVAGELGWPSDCDAAQLPISVRQCRALPGRQAVYLVSGRSSMGSAPIPVLSGIVRRHPPHGLADAPGGGRRSRSWQR